jgi:hypothetical protein
VCGEEEKRSGKRRKGVGRGEKEWEKSSLEVIPQILSATLSEWGRPHALSHPVNQPRHPGFNMSPGGWRLKTTHNIFLKETFARKWAQRWRKPSKKHK